jgi:hypothetical protein
MNYLALSVLLLATAVFATTRINSGSTAAFTDNQGKTWRADAYYTGGTAKSNTAISNQLMKFYRVFTNTTSPNGYKINMGTAGTYSVTLHFAEPYWTASGKRTFKANVQGTSVTGTSWIDIYALAGGYAKFWNKTVSTYTSNGYISISFTANVNTPLISGITVTSASTTPAPTTAPSSTCKSVLWTEDFSSSTLTNFQIWNCARGISAANGWLTLQLINGCGGSIIRSKNAYSSGYSEAVVQLGGQGADYSGLVYTFITQSDTSLTNPDEIDLEILGKNTGQVQTNWYINGSSQGVNGKNYNGYSMVTQSVKFGLRWNSSVAEWYINDVMVRNKTGSPYFSKPQYVWSSIWDGSGVSSWAGTANWATGPTSNYKMKIDYIKMCTTN